MSKMYEMILVGKSARRLILYAIGDCFGRDDHKYAEYAMVNNMPLFNAMVSDCVDHYYDIAAEPDIDIECGTVDRFMVDLFVRTYLFEYYNAQFLSKIPVEAPQAAVPKEAEKKVEDGKQSEKEKSQDKDQNLRDLGMTDEEIKVWKEHDCHACEKHDNFSDRLDCMRNNMDIEKMLKEIFGSGNVHAVPVPGGSILDMIFGDLLR